jgi:hypothetical protein
MFLLVLGVVVVDPHLPSQIEQVCWYPENIHTPATEGIRS